MDREILRQINEDAGRCEVRENMGRAPTKPAAVSYYLYFKDEETEA